VTVRKLNQVAPQFQGQLCRSCLNPSPYFAAQHARAASVCTTATAARYPAAICRLRWQGFWVFSPVMHTWADAVKRHDTSSCSALHGSARGLNRVHRRVHEWPGVGRVEARSAVRRKAAAASPSQGGLRCCRQRSPTGNFPAPFARVPYHRRLRWQAIRYTFRQGAVHMLAPY